MGFYEEFNKYYDDIFPAAKPQLDFLMARIPIEGKVMDVACGTGNYAIPLSVQGNEVFAVDFDEGMIKQLNIKAKLNDIKIHTYKEDMRKIGERLKEHSFESIFCIGNSLVHLTKLEEIYRVLNDFYRLLSDNGVLMLQTVNYDRILKYNINELPTIENTDAGVKLIRKYRYDQNNNIIHFDTQLAVKKNHEDKSFNNTVPLYPLRSNEIEEILNNMGFKNLKFYGSFGEADFCIDSFGMIIEARKF
ncbi:class I SAM-dependent methyltransferase [Alkaliphilus peptidifermentans]|uniref:Methyltransferase domain-containing protein n=1 Tax=Alkaliphilus peptidifermentans DSM 18978 TaxID=1120976 RepID=A0A1G5HU73_9FIRM|nr:class I SAM-dependent methyltransferase [Alkaliphilus peptidifermentans]SCY67415.1 Methyltransferase domain-containing protein [Alkaliphilus peptidifermentans DSM 18978]